MGGFGLNPKALGDFSNVNGGFQNSADGEYAVIAGGSENTAFSEFSTISGGDANAIAVRSTDSTISGGVANFIAFNAKDSVITGGIENKVCFFESDDDFNDFKENCSGCTISGGGGILCNGKEAVRTGGVGGFVLGDRSVATGGEDNEVGGKNAVIVGGKDNIADGTLSIALGTQAGAIKESSMVINLNPDGDGLESTKAGQFIANAESYKFQIGKNDDDLSIQITEDNIQNLIDALKNAAAQ